MLWWDNRQSGWLWTVSRHSQTCWHLDNTNSRKLLFRLLVTHYSNYKGLRKERFTVFIRKQFDLHLIYIWSVLKMMRRAGSRRPQSAVIKSSLMQTINWISDHIFFLVLNTKDFSCTKSFHLQLRRFSDVLSWEMVRKIVLPILIRTGKFIIFSLGLSVIRFISKLFNLITFSFS